MEPTGEQQGEFAGELRAGAWQQASGYSRAGAGRDSGRWRGWGAREATLPVPSIVGARISLQVEKERRAVILLLSSHTHHPSDQRLSS